MKKLLLPLFLLSCFLPAFSADSNSGETVRNFNLKFVKIPVYQKNKLDFIIFSARGRRHEGLLFGEKTLVDRLLPTADVDQIHDGWDEKIYPLESALPVVLDFWKRRYLSSETVLFTNSCRFDQKNNVISGNNAVFLRAPMFDLDGTGFRSNLNNSEIVVNSNVRIIARRDDCDPRGILSGKLDSPRTQTTVKAIGDTLRIDMEHNEFMLIGNVEVIDGNTTLNCDRLTIFLKPADHKNTVARKAGNEKNPVDSSNMLKGISRILADGEVKLARRLSDRVEDTQTAVCEHLEYEFDSGRIILSGEDSRPMLAQGKYILSGQRIELLRFSRKAFVTGHSSITEFDMSVKPVRVIRTITSNRADFDDEADLNIFTGNVVVTDSDATLSCDKMRVFLKKNQSSGKIKNPEYSPASGERELDKIFCDGNVKVVGKVRDPNAKSTAKPADKPLRPSVITSRRSEFDYAADKLVFYDDVKIDHQGDKLDCDRLDLFLGNSEFSKDQNKSSAPAADVAVGGRAANDKTLRKVIASGNVFMKDADSTLATDLMTLDFRELPPGTPVTPGMFTASNVQLIRISCDGSVAAATIPRKNDRQSGKRTLKSGHAMSDLLNDKSEFHKNVVMTEAGNTLYCSDMYVFTGKAPTANTADNGKTSAPAEVDPDLDPFAIPTENAAPSRIALSDGIDLKRIICKHDVLLINRDKQGITTHAAGDTAVYTVDTGDIVITADAPNRPYLMRKNRKQFSDTIRGNLHTEELSGHGNTQLVTIPEKK